MGEKLCGPGSRCRLAVTLTGDSRRGCEEPDHDEHGVVAAVIGTRDLFSLFGLWLRLRWKAKSDGHIDGLQPDGAWQKSTINRLRA